MDQHDHEHTEDFNEKWIKDYGGCPSNTDQQGHASQCEGCPGQKLCKQLSQSPEVLEENEKLRIRMNAVKHKILVVSGKGGVGKSSTAATIALAISKRNQKVGVLDVDICGPSIPRLLNVESKQVVNTPYGWLPIKSDDYDVTVMSVAFMLGNTGQPVIWRGPRKTNLIRRFLKDTFWGKLDYLVIDTPPGTSDEHLSVVNSLKQANPDGAVIVTTPQEVSLSTIRKEINFCKKVGLPILGIVENMSGFVCPCCGENTDIFLNGGGETLAKEYNIPFLGRVPLDPRVAETLDQGQSIFAAYPESPAVLAVQTIADSLISTLNSSIK